jgi:uncharacterized 2Fe-2S/4Fe-4S cluster protein (DUF4445 family)
MDLQDAENGGGIWVVAFFTPALAEVLGMLTTRHKRIDHGISGDVLEDRTEIAGVHESLMVFVNELTMFLVREITRLIDGVLNELWMILSDQRKDCVVATGICTDNLAGCTARREGVLPVKKRAEKVGTLIVILAEAFGNVDSVLKAERFTVPTVEEFVGLDVDAT